MTENRQGWALWFVGLPGSGKSTIAGAVYEALQARDVDAVWLEMDVRRKVYFPEPRYTSEERRAAYRMFAEEAAGLAAEGRGVLMDATAPKLEMRQRARDLIPRFAEVYIRSSLDTAMEREAERPGGKVMAGLYEKALERKRTGRQFNGLGQVIGVDVSFEENPDAEVVIDSEEMDVTRARDRVIEFLKAWI